MNANPASNATCDCRPCGCQDCRCEGQSLTAPAANEGSCCAPRAESRDAGCRC